MKQLLKQVSAFDIEAHCVKHSAAAFEVLASHHIDICLFDYYLDGETGVDVALEMHKRDIQIPIIMITGLDEDELLVKVTDHGIETAVSKEYLSVEQLTQALLKYFPDNT
jgi:DNA-binding NarL/FixJ family response regulator